MVLATTASLAEVTAASIASRLAREQATAHPSGPARGQTLYVSNYHNGTISRITSDGSLSTFVAGLDQPTGLAFHRARTLYVSEVGTGSILRITPRGRATTFASGLNGPRGLAFDAAGNLYVSEVGTGSILKITPGGRVTTFVSGLSEPSGNALDPTGNLYQSNFLSGTIVKITPGGRVFLFDSGLSEPEDLVLDRAGTLFEADFGSGRIHKIAPDGTVSVFASGLSSPLGLAFDRTGLLYEADYGSGKIHRVAPDGTATTFVSGLSGPAYLAFAPGPFVAAGHRLLHGRLPRVVPPPRQTAGGASPRAPDPTAVDGCLPGLPQGRDVPRRGAGPRSAGPADAPASRPYPSGPHLLHVSSPYTRPHGAVEHSGRHSSDARLGLRRPGWAVQRPDGGRAAGWSDSVPTEPASCEHAGAP